MNCKPFPGLGPETQKDGSIPREAAGTRSSKGRRHSELLWLQARHRGRAGGSCSGSAAMAQAQLSSWLLLCVFAASQRLTGRRNICQLLGLANLCAMPFVGCFATSSNVARGLRQLHWHGRELESSWGELAGGSTGTCLQVEDLLLCLVARGGFSWVST